MFSMRQGQWFFLALICYGIYVFCPLQAHSWSPPVNHLSLVGQNASSPQIAIDSFGNAIAVWYRFDGKHLIIQASVKPFGGDWQAVPDDLSLAEQDGFNPQIAIDPAGNATVIWEQFHGDHSIIQASTKPYGGKWQAIPETLSLPGYNASAPRVAMDSFGNAIAVWQSSNGRHSLIQASTKPFQGKWQAVPDTLSLSDQDATHPQIVIDSYAGATVVWQSFNGKDFIIQVSSKFFQGSWQAIPEDVSLPNHHAFFPQIAVDAFGNAIIVWNQFDKDYGMIQASEKAFGGKWQAVPDTLSPSGRNALAPRIAIDAFGNATAVWECFDANKLKCIHASTKIFGESWQVMPDTLSLPEDHNVNPQIAIDSMGNILVIWNSYKGFTHIYSSIKLGGGNWQAVPDKISSPGRSAFLPQVAFDPLGNAIAIWVVQDSLSFIQAAEILR
jgi:hypothetical protein